MTSPNSPLHQIIYLSELCEPQEQRIQEILNIALRYNPAHEITGMMLYTNGNILQILEGPQQQVDHLFARIQSDPRHQALFVVLNEPLESRHFPDWSMGYRKIDESSIKEFLDYEQVFRSTPQVIHNRVRSGVAAEVIQSFCKWAMN